MHAYVVSGLVTWCGDIASSQSSLEGLEMLLDHKRKLRGRITVFSYQSIGFGLRQFSVGYLENVRP